MQRVRWSKDEVIAYLEDKIKDEVATEEESEMYIFYIWNNYISKIKYTNTYKNLKFEMTQIYHGEM